MELILKNDRVGIIAIIDRMKQGRFCDVQPKLVILQKDKLDIINNRKRGEYSE